jgi:hypothetical protein
MRFLRIDWTTVFSVGELACFVGAWIVSVWATASAPRPAAEATVASVPQEMSLADATRK